MNLFFPAVQFSADIFLSTLTTHLESAFFVSLKLITHCSAPPLRVCALLIFRYNKNCWAYRGCGMRDVVYCYLLYWKGRKYWITPTARSRMRKCNSIFSPHTFSINTNTSQNPIQMPDRARTNICKWESDNLFATAERSCWRSDLKQKPSAAFHKYFSFVTEHDKTKFIYCRWRHAHLFTSAEHNRALTLSRHCGWFLILSATSQHSSSTLKKEREREKMRCSLRTSLCEYRAGSKMHEITHSLNFLLGQSWSWITFIILKNSYICQQNYFKWIENEMLLRC